MACTRCSELAAHLRRFVTLLRNGMVSGQRVQHHRVTEDGLVLDIVVAVSLVKPLVQEAEKAMKGVK